MIASGDLIAYPYDATLPGTSNLNWGAGQTIANAALVPACAPETRSRSKTRPQAPRN